MDQRTQDWLHWRRGGIGSSDAPIIMGVSPWSTPFQLWQEKTGRVKREMSNFATERGNMLEPKARADYELRSGIEMPPILCQHKDYPFMRASMDGGNEQLRCGLEIKCPGKKDHEIALIEGRVPEKYMPQIQHQLMVTGFEWIDYFSFDGEKGVSIRVYPDMEYIARLTQKEIEFWDFIRTDTAPPLSDDDYTMIRSVEFKRLAEEYRVIAQREKELRTAMSAIVKNQVARGYGIEIVRRIHKGELKLNEIQELKGVDVDKFRKPNYETEQFSVVIEEAKN